MKSDNSAIIGIAIIGGAILLANVGSKDATPKASGNIAVAKLVAKDYLATVGDGFQIVGQKLVDGEITKVVDAHSELADKSEEALDKYDKLNQLLLKYDDDTDLKGLGRLCIELGIGIKQARNPK